MTLMSIHCLASVIFCLFILSLPNGIIFHELLATIMAWWFIQPHCLQTFICTVGSSMEKEKESHKKEKKSPNNPELEVPTK